MYKNLIYLLFVTLLTGCAFKKDKTARKDAETDKTSWELAFKFTGGKTSVPFDKLSLNGQIPEHLMNVVIANLKVAKGVIAVRYKGIGKAKVTEVYHKLSEDDKIEILWIEEIKFKEPLSINKLN